MYENPVCNAFGRVERNEMKKVGIITFHHAKHSYGASLQALATLRVIEKMGFDAELINYENKYEQSEIKAHGKSIKSKLLMTLNWLARMIIFGGFADPCRKAKNLDRMYGNVSSKKYYSLKNLNEADYDILISGSDQIWNPAITGGIDRCFLLQFGKPEKRISYASSVGSHKFTDEELEIYKNALLKFCRISVREKYAADTFKSICKQKIKVVCDPTLLLNGQQWKAEFGDALANFKADAPYILTYFVGGNIDTYWSRIEKYVNQVNLPIYNIQSHSKRYSHVDRAIYNILPDELIAYIDNASIVLTDSFHGTAFSINLNKKFAAVLNKKNPMRVKNLLETLDLEKREDENLENCLDDIDYEQVNEKLERIRFDSYQWLWESIKE